MYKNEGVKKVLAKEVMLVVPVDNEIHKLDIVENMGLGIWFADTDLPSIICLTPTEEEAIKTMEEFKVCRSRAKFKLIKSKKEGEDEHS